LLAYLQLMRLPNVFTAMADVGMGFFFTHAVFRPGDGLVLGLLVGASSLLYLSGMVLNDVFDIRVDARQRPGRPLPSRRIPLARARYLGFGLLTVGLILAWMASLVTTDLRSGVVAVALAGCIVLYDGRLKRTPLGPAAMGSCRMLNVLLGMSAAVGPWQTQHGLAAVAIGTYVAGVTWFARNEAVKSSRVQLALATGLMLSGIGLLIPLPGMIENVATILREEPIRWPILIGLIAALVGRRCLRAVFDPTPRKVQAAVRHCILSLVVLDGAVVFVVGGLAPAVIILLLLVPTMFLGKWVYST
jgi:UbiA prenyltransferase family protein